MLRIPEPIIFILTAPVHSGKTTSLINWSAARNDVHGILTPVVGGKRVFMNAQTKEQFPMEATGPSAPLRTDVITVGRFVFSKAAFDKAIQTIRDAITKKDWLVIDEIGPMELRGEGFCEVLKEVLMLRKEKILLVVREGMAGQVIKYFNINDAETLHDITTLKKLAG
jgi:nucleoside-triphosphatase THEP1